MQKNPDGLSCWAEMIEQERQAKGDTTDAVRVVPPDIDLNERFDHDYGATCGKPFTLWTQARVYFPVEYDGAEWVGSVPRDPCSEVSEHHGGG